MSRRTIEDYAVEKAISLPGANLMQAPDLLAYFPEHKYLDSKVTHYEGIEAIELVPSNGWGRLGRLMGEVIFLPNHIVQRLDINRPEHAHLENAYLIGIPKERGATVFLDDVKQYPMLQWNIHMREELCANQFAEPAKVFEDQLIAQKLINREHVSYVTLGWIWRHNCKPDD